MGRDHGDGDWEHLSMKLGEVYLRIRLKDLVVVVIVVCCTTVCMYVCMEEVGCGRTVEVDPRGRCHRKRKRIEIENATQPVV